MTYILTKEDSAIMLRIPISALRTYQIQAQPDSVRMSTRTTCDCGGVLLVPNLWWVDDREVCGECAKVARYKWDLEG